MGINGIASLFDLFFFVFFIHFWFYVEIGEFTDKLYKIET